jgi:hypothetical protein
VHSMAQTPLPILVFCAMLAALAVLVCCDAALAPPAPVPPGGSETETALIVLTLALGGCLSFLLIVMALNARRWWIHGG